MACLVRLVLHRLMCYKERSVRAPASLRRIAAGQLAGRAAPRPKRPRMSTVTRSASSVIAIRRAAPRGPRLPRRSRSQPRARSKGGLPSCGLARRLLGGPATQAGHRPKPMPTMVKTTPRSRHRDGELRQALGVFPKASSPAFDATIRGQGRCCRSASASVKTRPRPCHEGGQDGRADHGRHADDHCLRRDALRPLAAPRQSPSLPATRVRTTASSQLIACSCSMLRSFHPPDAPTAAWTSNEARTTWPRRATRSTRTAAAARTRSAAASSSPSPARRSPRSAAGARGAAP